MSSSSYTPQTPKLPLSLSAVAQTLLISLSARANDATTPVSGTPILGDPAAAAVFSVLQSHYNLSSSSTSPASSTVTTNTTTLTTLPPSECASVALRTRLFDRWTTDFLARFYDDERGSDSDVLVIHLACGLDGRAQRVLSSKDLQSRRRTRNKNSKIHWVDIDLPEVISLRESEELAPLLDPTKSQNDNSQDGVDDFEKNMTYALIPADLSSSSASSWSFLPTLPQNIPTAIIMEGLVSYLTVPERQNLLGRFLSPSFSPSSSFSFSAGPKSELFLDCIHPTLLNRLRNPKTKLEAVEAAGAEFRSAVGEDVEGELLLGKGGEGGGEVGKEGGGEGGEKGKGEILEIIRFIEAPGVEELPLVRRAQLYLASWIPVSGVRDSVRLVRVGFGGGGGERESEGRRG